MLSQVFKTLNVPGGKCGYVSIALWKAAGALVYANRYPL